MFISLFNVLVFNLCYYFRYFNFTLYSTFLLYSIVDGYTFTKIGIVVDYSCMTIDLFIFVFKSRHFFYSKQF